MKLAVAIAIVGACATTSPTPTDDTDTILARRAAEPIACPTGTAEVVVTGVHYCAARCAGALEGNLWFAGLDLVARYDDGPVFAVRRQDSTIARPAQVPDDVCRTLPHGCACTSAACLYDWHAVAFDRDAIGIPPRCTADDPACGPEAFDHGCVAAAGTRKPITNIAPGYTDCDHDGECVNSGCGYQCESTRKVDPHVAYTCQGNSAMDHRLAHAMCGCIQHACAWFEM